MLWSWKKGDPEVLTAEMSEMKHYNKVLQLEDTEDIVEGASAVNEEGMDAEQFNNNNKYPIDHTGTGGITIVEFLDRF